MPSFSRPSLMTREYSSIRSDSSTILGSLSIGACVCDGAIIGRRGLSEKLGSRVPILEHCWHTIRVAPSTSDLPGLPTISCPQISQNKVQDTSGENVRNRLPGYLCRYRIANAPPACKAQAPRAEKNKGRGHLPDWQSHKQSFPENHPANNRP